MEDTCLFAESLCFALYSKPGSVREFLSRLINEASSVTLGDLQPSFQCLPRPERDDCYEIELFTNPRPPTPLFTAQELDKYIALLKSAGLFRLHVCRLANDAIRDCEVPYATVREKVSDIAKQFNLDLWLADFSFWMSSLTRPTLEELQRCLANAPASQMQPSLKELQKCLAGTPEEKQHLDFPLMLKLPEEFLKQVFEACKNLEEKKIDPFDVREMLDKCGHYYREVTQEELKQFHEEAEREAEKGEKEDRDFKYWNHVYAFSCPKPDLTESEAEELAEYIYDVCTELGIDCHILIGQGSVWVFVLVKERLPRQKRAKITKGFEEFVQSRKKTQLSWMFAGRPEERSPFLLPSGLQQVLVLIRLMVGDELRRWLILNVRNIRPLVLDCLRRRNEHVEPWQLRMVSGSRDLCDADWIKDISSLRILVCEDWTQWEDSTFKNLVLDIAFHLPKRRKECAFVEKRACAPLAYLCQALKVLYGIDPCTLLPGFASAESKKTCFIFLKIRFCFNFVVLEFVVIICILKVFEENKFFVHQVLFFIFRDVFASYNSIQFCVLLQVTPGCHLLPPCQMQRGHCSTSSCRGSPPRVNLWKLRTALDPHIG